MVSQRIGRACLNNATEIALVLYESFAEYKSLYTHEGFLATVISSEQIQERINEGPVWIALQNDKIVGTISVVEKKEGLYIRGMAILPSTRGQGIGRQLIEYVENFAKEIKASRMFLSTTPFLKSAIKLYERFGFCQIAEPPYDLYGTLLFTMEKRLL